MMRRRGIFVSGLFAASALAAPALAQDSGALRDRTGPLAQPPAAPDYAAPAPDALAPPPVPAYVPPRARELVRLDRVDVETQGTGVAMPRPGWLPSDDPATGLTLTAPADGFSAGWVAQQFEANALVGGPADYARIVALVQRINRAILANGYANSGVLIAAQPSDGNAGTLALRLVNGRIGDLEGNGGLVVSFAEKRTQGLGERYVAQRMGSAGGGPFNAFDLERDFRLLAADPAIRTVDASLRPGRRPGEATLDVIVDPESRVDLYALGANNRSPAVGEWRGAVGGSLRNVMTGGDVTAFEAGLTDGLKDALVSYAGPVFGPRTSLLLRGAINDAAVVESQLAALDIESREWSIEGGIAHKLIDEPLIPDNGAWRSARSLSVGALVVHRRTTSKLLGQPFSFSPGAVDGRAEYTALRLTQDFVERGVKHVLAVSLTETLGVEGTRASAPGTISPRQNFVAFLAQASFARRLTDRLEVVARLAGQYTGGTVYSGERFSIGGENSVRGYRENLMLADRALFGSVELGYDFSLTGAAAGQGDFDVGRFRIGAFVDGALADNARAPEPLPRSVASVGASLAWKPSDAITAKVTFGEALRDARVLGKRHLQDKGWQFRLVIHPLRLFR